MKEPHPYDVAMELWQVIRRLEIPEVLLKKFVSKSTLQWVRVNAEEIKK